MVTRYTIDHILSHTSLTLSDAGKKTMLGSPLRPASPIISFDPAAHSVTPPPTPTEPTKRGFRLTDDAGDTHSVAGDNCRQRWRSSSECGEEPPGEGGGLEARTHHKRMDALPPPPLARPVALRPHHPPSRDLPGLEGDLRLLYGGGGMTGLGGSVYGMMLRQYMEEQYRGLVASHSPFVPLPYPALGIGVAGALGRSRRRGGQVRFTADQSRQLEDWFRRHKYITPPQRKTIASELNLQERQVKTWFQNRRAKWRKVQAQHGGPVEVVTSPHSSHEDSDEDEEAVGASVPAQHYPPAP